MQFGFTFFLTQYTGGELFSALRKLKKIVNLTVRLPVRKTSFLFSIDYRVTVGKAKGHRRFLFKQVKCQKRSKLSEKKHHKTQCISQKKNFRKNPGGEMLLLNS